MKSPWRGPAALAVAVLIVVVAACGPAPSGNQGPGAAKAVTLRGRLMQVRGRRLTVRDSSKRQLVRVHFAPMGTPIYAVTRSSRNSIEPGSCVSTSGVLDPGGTVRASEIVVAASVDDTCPATSEPDPPPSVAPSPSPRSSSPVAPPSPSPDPGAAVLHGQVLSVAGGALAVQSPEGNPVVVLMPPDVRVLFFQPAGPSALVVSSCVVIHGARSGHTITARQIVDWPPRPEC